MAAQHWFRFNAPGGGPTVDWCSTQGDITVRQKVQDFIDDFQPDVCEAPMIISVHCATPQEAEPVEPHVKKNKQLEQYFKEELPQILNAQDFQTVTYIKKPVQVGAGKYGRVFLVRHRTTRDFMVVKLFQDTTHAIRNCLLEYMFQHKAHLALRGGSVTTPKPVGLLCLKKTSRFIVNTSCYLLVSEFCSLTPG